MCLDSKLAKIKNINVLEKKQSGDIFEEYLGISNKQYLACLINEDYKVLARDPYLIMEVFGKDIVVKTSKGVETIKDIDVWNFVQEVLRFYSDVKTQGVKTHGVKTPNLFCDFQIGCIAALGYDMVCQMKGDTPEGTIPSGTISKRNISSEDIPDAVFVFHKNYTVFLDDKCFEISLDLDCDTIVGFLDVKSANDHQNIVHANFKEDEYKSNVDKAKEYIRTGDIYQVNLAQKFWAQKNMNDFDIFKKFFKASKPKFSVYIENTSYSIITCSPERFLKKKGNRLVTEPIKGTSPRGKTGFLDDQLFEKLMNNNKEEAELAMIVDIARNDIARSAEPGTVEVEEFKKCEKYPNVFHLSSIVAANALSSKSSMQIIHDAFPPASVTGCPKHRALEIIEELENFRRGFYCGAIGSIGFNGDFDLTMAIRTIVCIDEFMYYFAGSGIVLDSDSQMEYDEVLAKAKPFFEVVE